MKKRMFAMLLALVMIVSTLPVVSFAAEATERNCSWTHTLSGSNKQQVAVIEAGTCQTPGFVQYRCTYSFFGSRCNNTWIEEESTVSCNTSIVEEKAATCSESGHTAGIVCSDCGQSTTRCAYCAENLSEVIPASQHIPEAIPDSAPTCSQDGTTGGTRCSVCKTTLTDPVVNTNRPDHDFSVFVETIVEPNCAGKGSDLYKCSKCEATEERETTAGGHVWEFVRYQKDNAPTCSKTGVGVFDCKYCDEVSAQTVPALGHDKIVLGDVVAASCEKEGIRAYKCGREGCTNMWLDYVDATGHSEVPIDAVPATCTATGLTEGKMCTVCKEITLAQSVAPMIPHTFNVDVAELKATCTKDGYTAHKKCQFCDATEGKEVLHLLGHNFVNFICTRCEVRDGSCEHVNGVISIKNATCTEDGKERFTCPDCGYAYEKTLSHPGHSAVEGICTTCGTVVCNHPSHKKTVNTTPSTCSEYGTRTETCTCGWSKTVRLPLADHDYVNGVCKNCKCIGSENTTIDFNDVFMVG